MAAHVTMPGQWKRSAAISACRQEVGVTARVAEAAWNRLSDDLRGARGQHKGRIIAQN